MNITCTEIDSEKLSAAVIERLSRNFASVIEEKFEEYLAQRIREECESAAESLVIEKLEPLVDAVLRDGFPRTDRYGDRQGTNVTLPEYIRGKLTTVQHSRSWLDEKIKTELDKVWKEDLSKEVKAAKAAFRQSVDDRLGAELAKAAREAAGIR